MLGLPTLSFEVVLLFLFLLVLFPHDVDDFTLFFRFATRLLVHELIEVVFSIIFLLVSLLELRDSVLLVSLCCMFLPYFEVLNGFMELFVLHALFLLLEVLDAHLLLQKSTFHISHVLVCLKHFSEEIVRS